MVLEKFYADKIRDSSSFSIPHFLIELACHLLGVFVAFRFFTMVLNSDYTTVTTYIDTSILAFLVYGVFLTTLWSCNALPRFLLRKLRRYGKGQGSWYRHHCSLLQKMAPDLADAIEPIGDDALCLVESPSDGEETSGTTLWFSLFFVVWYSAILKEIHNIDGSNSLFMFTPFLAIPLLAPLCAKKVHWLTPFVGFISLIVAIADAGLFSIPHYHFPFVLLAIVLLQFLMTIKRYWYRPLPRLMIVEKDKMTIVRLPYQTGEASSIGLAEQNWTFIEEPSGGYSVELEAKEKFTLATPSEVDELAKIGLIDEDWLVKLTSPRFFRREGLAIGVCLLSFFPTVFIVAYNDNLKKIVTDDSPYTVLRNLPSQQQIATLVKMNSYSTLGYTLSSMSELRAGRLTKALELAEQAKKLSGDDFSERRLRRKCYSGKLLEILSATDFKLAETAIALDKDLSSKKLDDLINVFEKNEHLILSEEHFYEMVLEFRRRIYQENESKESLLKLLYALTFIDRPTLSPFTTAFQTLSTQDRHKEALSLLSKVKRLLSDEEHRLLTARVHFKFEEFNETLSSLEGLTSIEAKLLYTSAARYCGKSKKELLRLVANIGFKTLKQDNEVAMLLGLILAQTGDFIGARSLLQKRYDKQINDYRRKRFIELFKVLEALICNQHPSLALSCKSLSPVSFEGILKRKTLGYNEAQPLIAFGQLEWVEWMSTADMEYLTYLVAYAKRNLYVFGLKHSFKLLPAPKKDVLERLSKLTWYPYAQRAKEMFENII